MISSQIAVDCSAEVKDFARLALLYEMLPVRPSRRENVPMHSRWCLRFSSPFCEIVFFSLEAAFVSRETACFSVGASRERQFLSPGFDLPPTDAKKLSAVANTWAGFPPGFPPASTRNSFPPQLSHSLPVLSYCRKLPNKGKLQALNAWMSRR